MFFYSKVLPDAGNLNGKRHAHHNVCRRSVGGVNENGVCHDTAPKYLHFAVLFCGQRWLRNLFHRFLESEKLQMYMNERSKTPPERFWEPKVERRHWQALTARMNGPLTHATGGGLNYATPCTFNGHCLVGLRVFYTGDSDICKGEGEE